MGTKLKIDNENAVLENVETGGDITVRAADDVTGDGGAVVLEGGDGDGSGSGGAVFIRPGYGGGSAPTIPVSSGVPEPAEFWFVDGDATPGYVGFKAPNAVSDGSTGDGANTVWTLPEGDGAANEVMITDGAGILSWSSIAAAGGVQNPMTATLDAAGYQIRTANDSGLALWLQGGDAVSAGGSAGNIQIYGGDITSANTTDVQGGTVAIRGGTQGRTDAGSFFGGSITLDSGDATGNATGEGGIIRLSTGDGTVSGGDVIFQTGYDTTDDTDNGAVVIASAFSASAATELRFHEIGNYTSNQYLALKAPDSVTNSRTLELPDGVGTAGQVLTTDGATPTAALSWTTVAAAPSGSYVETPMLANLDVSTFDIIGSPPATTSSNGGDIDIIAGTGGTVDGDGGNISITAGSAVNTAAQNSAGGDITFQAGANDGSSAAGDIELKGGDAVDTGRGGHIRLQPGTGTTQPAVFINPQGGTGGPGELRFVESGTPLGNYLGLKAPSSVVNDKVFEMSPKFKTVATTSDTVAEDDDVVLVDPVTAAGNVTLTLHSAANERFRHLNIKVISQSASFTVTVQRAGADTIDGATTYVFAINSQWASVTLANDKGTGWYVL